jgi:hypothetical protein
MLLQHLCNLHQLIALSSPPACHPWHIQLTCLQDVCNLLISDFQNLSCHCGSGSSREIVKILERAELPNTLHASYMFIQTHFCCQSTFEYSCTNREAQSWGGKQNNVIAQEMLITKTTQSNSKTGLCLARV